jgi:hypothetical protein
MENVITALIIIGVLILAILGLSERAISAQTAILELSRLVQERATDRARTDLTPLSTTTSFFGDHVEVTLKNAGDTKLADFEHWDVIVRYTDAGSIDHVDWYGYPGQWSKQIFQDASISAPEAFDPGILNPGEEIVLQIQVSPAVGGGTTNLVTVATPNGITASTVFTR